MILRLGSSYIHAYLVKNKMIFCRTAIWQLPYNVALCLYGNTKNSHFHRLANSGEGDEHNYHGWFNLQKFQNYIKDQYEKGEEFYTWNGLRYFLFEYELYLQGKANQKVEFSDFNKRKKEDTTEHIYPQTARHLLDSVFNVHSIKEKKALLHSLGSIVLLCQSKNSELQNKCFDFKEKL